MALMSMSSGPDKAIIIIDVVSIMLPMLVNNHETLWNAVHFID